LADHPNLGRWFKFGNPSWTGHFFKFPSSSTNWRPVHTGDNFTEYQALLTASLQIQYSAFDYASFGSFQIVGKFHHEKLGFQTSIAMYSYMSASQGNDTEIGLRFIATSPTLISSLQRKDLNAFVREYNGSGNIPMYVNLLNKALARI